jgi:hypothetical protein
MDMERLRNLFPRKFLSEKYVFCHINGGRVFMHRLLDRQQ